MLGNTTATMTNNRTWIKSCGLKWKEARLRTRVTKSRVHGQILESLFSQGSVFGGVTLFECPNSVMLTGMKAYFELERNV